MSKSNMSAQTNSKRVCAILLACRRKTKRTIPRKVHKIPLPRLVHKKLKHVTAIYNIKIKIT
eukprot:4562242-Amphidinium_carterae.1